MMDSGRGRGAPGGHAATFQKHPFCPNSPSPTFCLKIQQNVPFCEMWPEKSEIAHCTQLSFLDLYGLYTRFAIATAVNGGGRAAFVYVNLQQLSGNTLFYFQSFNRHSLTPPSNPLPQRLKFNACWHIHLLTYLFTYLLTMHPCLLKAPKGDELPCN